MDNGHKKFFISYRYNDPNKENKVEVTIAIETIPNAASPLPLKHFYLYLYFYYLAYFPLYLTEY